MKYFTPAEARTMRGLRLVLTCGQPGSWGESAKKILEYKGIDYIPVAQYSGQENRDLVAWTGIRNAPVAVYEDEPPRSGWYDILVLAERLAPERPLLPESSEARATVVGISAEICSEWGFGWVRRVMMTAPRPSVELAVPPPADFPLKPEEIETIARAYGAYTNDPVQAERRAADIMRMLAARLHRQKAAGSPYLVGDGITACDIYWTCFSMMLKPLPHDVNPMPGFVRAAYETGGPVMEAAKDPILLEHRAMMYDRHLKLPLDY